MGEETNILKLIPKYEEYIRYELEMVMKMPKVTKYMMGNEYIANIMGTLKSVHLLQKVDRSKRLPVLNEIDANCSYQRVCLGVMYKWRYIDEKKFNMGIKYLKEIGLMLGGYMKGLTFNIYPYFFILYHILQYKMK